MKFVVLGLGSNRSFASMDSLCILRNACSELMEFVTDFRMSSVYRTKPMYVENQQFFYNMVVCGFIDDNLSPHDLLSATQKIEAAYGRDRSREIRNGPRPLDIDIELFGNDVIDTDDLQIPHPRIEERAFVVIPLLEILAKYSDIKLKKNFFKIGEELNWEDAQIFCSSQDLMKFSQEKEC